MFDPRCWFRKGSDAAEIYDFSERLRQQLRTENIHVFVFSSSPHEVLDGLILGGRILGAFGNLFRILGAKTFVVLGGRIVGAFGDLFLILGAKTFVVRRGRDWTDIGSKKFSFSNVLLLAPANFLLPVSAKVGGYR